MSEYLADITRQLEENAQGHRWRRDEVDPAYIDTDAFEGGVGRYCNGPVCEKCGYGFCMHCYQRVPQRSCPVQEPGPKEKRKKKEKT